MGSASEDTLGDQKLSFADNIITGYDQFDDYWLQICKYMNLSGSSFNMMGNLFFTNLLYINIAFSEIVELLCYEYKKL